MLLVSETKSALKGTHLLKYIRWGERQAFHERPTCAARNPWYDLRPRQRGEMFWPMAQQYRHVIGVNSANLLCNHNLFDITSRLASAKDTLAAVLNSTLVALSKHQFGRYMGREGNLKTEVVDVNMMLVPDIRRAHRAITQRLEAALASMKKRSALPLTEEFELSDRQQLDDAVLELIGARDPAVRMLLREEIYAAMRSLYEETRKAELQMQVYRRQMARRGRLTPRSIAHDIWDTYEKDGLRHFPEDFVPGGVAAETLELAPAKKIRLVDDLFQKGTLRANGHTYALRHPDRAAFAARLIEECSTGRVLIPTDPKVCARAVAEHDRYRAALEEDFRERAAEHTADEEWQEKIVAELWKLHRAARV